MILLPQHPTDWHTRSTSAPATWNRLPCSSPGSGHSRRRLDILIEPEQVGRIVLGLDLGQSRIVGAIGAACHAIAILRQSGEVEISTAVRIGLHVGPKAAYPGQVERI